MLNWIWAFLFPAEADPTDVLVMQVRVHTLRSDVPAVHSQLDRSTLEAWMEGVNRIYAPHGIRFQVESVVQEKATASDRALHDAERGGSLEPKQILPKILPTDQRLAPHGLDLLVLRRMPQMPPGVYLPSDGLVVVPEAAHLGRLAGTELGVRILAHELGHALGLRHEPCTSMGNLMATSCDGLDRERLTPDQVAQARAVAATGRPVSRD
jgi:hypothetical protein